MLIQGWATAEGTARYRDRFAAQLPGHFRPVQDLWISSIGLGTYLGEADTNTDRAYHQAIKTAVALGINVFDSAINYRHQRSERVIGQALAELISAGSAQRDEVVLATKGGFLSFDGSEPEDPASYFYEKLIKPGIVRSEEVTSGCHVMSPKYLDHQIDASRENLGVETLDIYFLHNPETQLSAVPKEEFYRRLRAAFETLERAVAAGKIRMYGTATWNAHRVPPESSDAIALEDVLRAAEEAGAKDHHFRALQFPFNFAMLEALGTNTQQHQGKLVPLLHLARSHNLAVFASATLLQSRLASGLPPEFRKKFPQLKTDAQRAIQFARSAPGITCALVGMSVAEHVEENLAAAGLPPLSLDAFRALFSK